MTERLIMQNTKGTEQKTTRTGSDGQNRSRTASLAGSVDYRTLTVLRCPGGVVVVTDVGDIHPRVTHFIDRTIAESDPLIRIGVVAICPRIVVPRGNANHGALRIHRSGIVGEDVVSHPIEVEFADVADDFGGAIR